MTRIGITIGVALTVGIAIGVVLMWTISPPESNSGLHKDAET